MYFLQLDDMLDLATYEQAELRRQAAQAALAASASTRTRARGAWRWQWSAMLFSAVLIAGITFLVR